MGNRTSRTNKTNSIDTISTINDNDKQKIYISKYLMSKIKTKLLSISNLVLNPTHLKS